MTAMLSATLLLAGLATGPGDDRAGLLRKLEGQRVTVDFDQIPLSEAIGTLRGMTGLNFVLHPKVLAQAPDLKVRLKVSDLNLRSVLRLLLGPLDLVLSGRDGVLQILPRAELNDGVTMKMIDVRKLLVRLQDAPGPRMELAPRPGVTLICGLSCFDFIPPSENEDQLVQLLKGNTGGDSWESNPKTSLTLSNGKLFISQSPAVIREAEALLNRLGQYP